MESKEIREKADRLVDLYYLADNNINDMLTEEQAIQCAIIDVNNTIGVLSKMKFIPIMEKDEFLNHFDVIKFHEQVKQELESRLNK